MPVYRESCSRYALKVARLFRQVGYDGTATIEVFGDDDDYLVMSREKFKRQMASVEGSNE